jgi:xanthine dehydrogenase accessory factor
MVLPSVEQRAAELRRQRVPFVHARVVLAERPTSAKPGDEAVVLGDGTMDGFVGGECAEATVRAQAMALLDSGESLLLRITPEPEEPGPTAGNRVVVHNPCLSGGTLEIFLEPEIPVPRIVVFGDSPVAQALLALGAPLGYAVDGWDGELPADTSAVVVASHGRNEPDVLTDALRGGVEYVGLVASRKRGEAVVAGLPVDEAARARVVSPAGLDIGARTPQEVALAILADIVARRPRPTLTPPPTSGAQHGLAVDPVCGMAVATLDSTLHLDHDGERHWFCGSGCLRAFAADPAAYLDH